MNYFISKHQGKTLSH